MHTHIFMNPRVHHLGGDRLLYETPELDTCPGLPLFFSFKMPVNKYFKLRCQFWGRRSVQMAGKRKKGRPAKTLIQPTIIESGLYPAIAVPMSLIGKHILVPGSYWPYRRTLGFEPRARGAPDGNCRQGRCNRALERALRAGCDHYC